MKNTKQNKFKVSKVTAKIYKKSIGITVNKDKLQDQNHTKIKSQPIDGLNECYKNITKEEQRLAITSDCTANMTNKELKNSVNIKECATKIYLDTVTDNINKNIKGKQHIPTKHEIMKSSTFGKPSIEHSFTSEAYFEHVTIFILKSGFLHKNDNEKLL